MVNPTKQEVRQGSPKNDCVNFLTNVCLHVIFLFLSFVFCLLSCFLLLCLFSIISENLPNQVPRKAIGAIEAYQMDDLLYQERSIDHLDFSPMKGIFCIQYCLYLFVRLYFSLIASVMKIL